jgi:hypothetical protein
MIVPQYWSEARRQQRSPSRQMTVRRYGWSDESQDDADRMAAARADEALARALADPQTPRREPKVPYNGAEGVPIREEIVGRHGTAAVTRNSYGARCLNTPEVLFADVDWQLEPGCWASGVAFVAIFLIFIVGLSYTLALAPGGLLLLFTVISLITALSLATPAARAALRVIDGGPEQMLKAAIARVHTFVDGHPRWNVRLYETPAGLRLVATHATFDPRSTEVDEFFHAVGVDPIYRRMCLNQNCFRARLSAKPWRCGVESHLKPRPGVWPVRPERMAERTAWIEAYEKRAANYAACRFLETYGSGIVHAAVASVVTFHDNECRALVAGLPLA